jgi:nucleoside-diphosphate-sugar epimerase
MENNKIKILITGANGNVGQKIVKNFCKDKNFKIYANYHNNLPSKSYSGVVWFKDDILSPSKYFIKVIKDSDVIIHLASKLGMFDKDCIRVNVNGTKNILKSICLKKRIKFIYISSIEAFGTTGIKGALETDKPHPYSMYGMSKLLAEKEIIKFSKKNKYFNYVILRVGNIVGIKDDLFDKLMQINNSKNLKDRLIKFIFGNCELSIVKIETVQKIIKTIIERNDYKNKIRFLTEKTVSINSLLRSELKRNLRRRKIFNMFISKLLGITKKGGFYLYLCSKSKNRDYRRYSNKIFKELKFDI